MALPSFQDAYNTVFNSAHQNVFFSRLQAQGIVPQNEKEAQDLMMLAANLRDAVAQEKQASSRFSTPLNVLTHVNAGPQDNTLLFKQAAAQLASDPNIYNSVLALAAHEAANVA